MLILQVIVVSLVNRNLCDGWCYIARVLTTAQPSLPRTDGRPTGSYPGNARVESGTPFQPRSGEFAFPGRKPWESGDL